MKGTGLLQSYQFYPHRVSVEVRSTRTMDFKFTADIRFSAVDLDDAFKQLEEHFRSLQDTTIESPLEFIGTLEVNKE